MFSFSKFTALPLLAATLFGTGAANAGVVYDALGGMGNGGDPIAAAGPILADRFVTAGADSISKVTLDLSGMSTSTGGVSVDLFTDAGTGPGTATVLGTILDSQLTSAFQYITLTLATPVALAANTSYYIGIMDNGGSTATLQSTLSGYVLARPTVAAGADYYNNGGVQANAGGAYQIGVNAKTPVAEPGAAVLLVGGMGVLGLALKRRAR